MANQGFDRRVVLEMLAKAAVASQFPGFSRWVFAGAKQRNVTVDSYRPDYFSQTEFRVIETLTDLIIPADETPGAKEAGVAEFIDFMASHGETAIQQPVRNGLVWLDEASKREHRKSFAHLTMPQQSGILKFISVAKEGNEAGHEFFLLMRRYTTMGYYTSRIGLEELDFPGLRFYEHSPACPHTNDPEHLHLPPPKF